jgi:hypothetical protein
MTAWLVAILAISAGVDGARAETPQCAAEPACITRGCTGAFTRSTSQFPYTLAYTTTGDAQSTTFIWKVRVRHSLWHKLQRRVPGVQIASSLVLLVQVCSLPCTASDPHCQPLRTFQLRLADQILAGPAAQEFRVLPTGTLTTSCSPFGPGLLLNSTNLEPLSTNDPAQVGYLTCFLFVDRGPPQLPRPIQSR